MLGQRYGSRRTTSQGFRLTAGFSALEARYEVATTYGISSFAPGEAGQVLGVGSVSGALPGQASAGLQDASIVKLGSDGKVIWARQWGTGARDNASHVGVAEDGSVIVVGESSTVQADQGTFWLHYSADGTLLGAKQYPSVGANFDNLLVEPSGSAYVSTSKGLTKLDAEGTPVTSAAWTAPPSGPIGYGYLAFAKDRQQLLL